MTFRSYHKNFKNIINPYISMFQFPISISMPSFQHSDVSASAELFACAGFSAYLPSKFFQDVDCFKIDKIKIENISNIKFSAMAYKTGLLLLNKINEHMNISTSYSFLLDLILSKSCLLSLITKFSMRLASSNFSLSQF